MVELYPARDDSIHGLARVSKIWSCDAFSGKIWENVKVWSEIVMAVGDVEYSVGFCDGFKRQNVEIVDLCVSSAIENNISAKEEK